MVAIEACILPKTVPPGHKSLGILAMQVPCERLLEKGSEFFMKDRLHCTRTAVLSDIVFVVFNYPVLRKSHQKWAHSFIVDPEPEDEDEEDDEDDDDDDDDDEDEDEDEDDAVHSAIGCDGSELTANSLSFIIAA